MPTPPSVPVNDYDSALRSVRNAAFLGTTLYQDQQHRAVRDGAHPDLLDWERAFVKELARLGVPVFASEVWRDAARQTELYVKGNSKAQAGQSPHQYGLAVDLIYSQRGWDIDPKAWALFGHIGKELALRRGLKITWGGDFKSLWDPAHWELTNWKQLKEEAPWPPKN